MFRYIALAWDDNVLSHAAAALDLSRELRARKHWQPALHRPGLHVYVRDGRQGINGDYPLRADQGVVVGKLFRRSDLDRPLGQDLSLTDEEGSRILHSGGQALVQEYWGRYVALMQTASGATRVLRDPSGTLPCFLLRHQGAWIVFSWLEDILADLRQVQAPSVNWEGLAGHILFGELSGRETALKEVVQVLPGEVVQLGQALERSQQLWNAVDFARSVSENDRSRSAQQLRDTVRACAQSWASCHDDILFRLSGGVDSSILLSCLARGSTPARVICVNYHSPGSDSDERAYSRLAAARAGREVIERQRDAGFRIESALKMARTPTPGNYVGRMNAKVDAELAAQYGASALFTGAGGDQLFFEFARWWPAADYLRCRGIGPGLVTPAMDAARLGRVSVWTALALAVADRVHPSKPWQEAHGQLPLIGPAALDIASQLDRFVHPALLGATRLPIGKLTQTRALMYPVAYYDPLEQGSAPETVNPLLSQPLVELCLQLPTWVLTFGGRGRALARLAFAAELPPEIAGRRSKGGMEEHIKAVLLRNIDFARSMLLDGDLVRRGLLDRAKVEDSLSSRPTTLAGHIGRIHVYIGIEAWLSRWSTRSTAT